MASWTPLWFVDDTRAVCVIVLQKPIRSFRQRCLVTGSEETQSHSGKKHHKQEPNSKLEKILEMTMSFLRQQLQPRPRPLLEGLATLPPCTGQHGGLGPLAAGPPRCRAPSSSSSSSSSSRVCSSPRPTTGAAGPVWRPW
uniref:Uncharacterized protein n=1 Tax=Takifugu rubripes TaxID=31033 RepID=A0A674NT19_TAKRU